MQNACLDHSLDGLSDGRTPQPINQSINQSAISHQPSANQSAISNQPSANHPSSNSAKNSNPPVVDAATELATAQSINQSVSQQSAISHQSVISHLRTGIVAACRPAPPPGGVLRRSTAVEHLPQQALFHNSIQQSCSGPRSPSPWPSFNHVFNRRSDLIVLFLGPYVWHPFSSLSWFLSTCSAVLRVRHQLVDSASRGPAVPVCPARLPDVSLAPAMTCAMLRALVVGNQELLQLPLITGCLRDDCDETFLPPSPSPHPALSRRRSRANNLQHAPTIYPRGITQSMVQVQHGLVHVT